MGIGGRMEEKKRRGGGEELEIRRVGRWWRVRACVRPGKGRIEAIVEKYPRAVEWYSGHGLAVRDIRLQGHTRKRTQL